MRLPDLTEEARDRLLRAAGKLHRAADPGTTTYDAYALVMQAEDDLRNLQRDAIHAATIGQPSEREVHRL